MKDWYSNWENRKSLFIKDTEDYKNKIAAAYKKWAETGFSEELIEKLEERWFPCTNTWNFIKLLKAKRKMSEDEYKTYEEQVLRKFEEGKEALSKLARVMEAEEKAFRDEGIEEGKVEYVCPLCGGIAVANRYKYGGLYHGLGSGCKTCEISHT